MVQNNYSIIYTPLSRSDFIDIFDYIAEDNISAALNLIELIEHSIDNLVEFPYLGTIPPDTQLRLKGYRLLFIDKYTVIYKPSDPMKTVTIHRVLSIYRDYIDLLK